MSTLGVCSCSENELDSISTRAEKGFYAVEGQESGVNRPEGVYDFPMIYSLDNDWLAYQRTYERKSGTLNGSEDINLVPCDLLSSMSTESLIVTYLDYSCMKDLWLCNPIWSSSLGSVQRYIQTDNVKTQLLQELLNRADIVPLVLSYYKILRKDFISPLVVRYRGTLDCTIGKYLLERIEPQKQKEILSICLDNLSRSPRNHDRATGLYLLGCAMQSGSYGAFLDLMQSEPSVADLMEGIGAYQIINGDGTNAMVDDVFFDDIVEIAREFMKTL